MVASARAASLIVPTICVAPLGSVAAGAVVGAEGRNLRWLAAITPITFYARARLTAATAGSYNRPSPVFRTKLYC
jgi:hypothetical protein